MKVVHSRLALAAAVSLAISATLAAGAALAGSAGSLSPLVPGKAAQTRSPQVTTGPLTRLISTQLRFVGSTGTVNPVPAGTYVDVSGLNATINCPGPGACVLEANVQTQIGGGSSGLMGHDLVIDGVGMDSAIASTKAITPAYEMAERDFVVRILPGNHAVKTQVYSTVATNYIRRSAAYRVYKP